MADSRMRTPVNTGEPAMAKQCIAQAVAQGDIVNFRFLFLPMSPLRADSPEQLSQAKYAYLLPDNTQDGKFQEALEIVQRPLVWAHVQAQLDKKGPAQLPADLLLPLADNALILEKYSAAAQAYELLRIRRRMEELLLEEADAALAQHNLKAAVKGYRLASRLAYDYAAFPEPLPAVPDYQNAALFLHAEYPATPEEAICLQPTEIHVSKALHFLLQEGSIAERLEQQPLTVRVDFLVELVHQLDPAWETFLVAYRESHRLMLDLGDKLKEQQKDVKEGDLASDLSAQEEALQPGAIMSALLGRTITPGEWWQYLKEIACEHPAAPLFLARQLVTRDTEVIMPRYREDSELVKRLGIAS